MDKQPHQSIRVLCSIWIAPFALVLALGATGCVSGTTTQTDNVQTAAESNPAQAPLEPVSTRVALSGVRPTADTTETAWVTISNLTETTQTAADFLGIKIVDEQGHAVYDSMPQRPIYPTVSISLVPGESRTREYQFRVPPPGRYEVFGYFQDDSETAGFGFDSDPTR